MKSFLYIAFNDCENTLFGVQSKILSQCRTFETYGYKVELIERSGASTVLMRDDDKSSVIHQRKKFIHNYCVRSVLDKQYQIRDIKRYVAGKRYDACYIRYDFSDPGFIHLLKALRKVCGKIALELPTFPYDAENSAMLLSRIKLSVDKFYRRYLRKYVDFIVTFYAGHEEIFGVPTVIIPNGFDFSSLSMVRHELPRDVIHIIAVSSMREWHGYERIIEGIRLYYQKERKDQRNIILHLVGKGREYEKYRALIEQNDLQRHIILEGAMHGEPLDELYEQCALGIDSLARHRSGIDVLSSLKSREYGAKGIPMINSCRIDVIDDDFPYLLRVPADETPIDMESIIAFFDKCYGAELTRMEVAARIRSYMEARSGMRETMYTVIDKLDP